jgi:putative ABC transport system permease protein
MDALIQNIRYGLRQIWRAPLFTVAAVATLALGIGANTALFTLGSAIMSKPLPGVNQSDRMVWVMNATKSGRPVSMSYPDFLDYRSGLSGLLDLSASTENDFALSGDGEPVRVKGIAVSANFFAITRTPFALGRGFTAEEDSAGKSAPVVVLSHRLWQRRYAGDSSIVGKRVVVNSVPLTVVGVTASGFNGADLEEPRGVFLPMATFRVILPGFTEWDDRGSRWAKGIGRMKAGVTIDQVRSAAQTIAVRNAAADTASHLGLTAFVGSAKSGLPPGAEKEVVPVAMLSAVVTGLILLIACANVSNLLLARGVSRRREIGIRLSIGATRMRLVAQLLTESSMLALLSAAAGILLAYLSTDWLLSSGVLPLQFDVRPDAGIIAFTTGAAAFAAIVFGLVPAIEATKTDVSSAVKDGTAGRDPRRARIQSGFVVTQLALSLVLLTTSGLFLRSMYKARNVEIGFEATAQVVGVSVDLGIQNYSAKRAATFVEALRDRALAIPGVQKATFTDVPPMGNRYIIGDILLEGETGTESNAANPRPQILVNQASVRPGYFAVLGMQLQRGRDFTAADDKSAPGAVIVSQTTAKTLWPGQDALGKRIRLRGLRSPLLSVVGIAPDVMLGGPTENKLATTYVPSMQYEENGRITMLVRTAGEPGQLAAGLRQAVRELDPDLPVFDVQTLAQYRQIKLSERMNAASIIAAFGGLALLLASIGVYGVMAFSVMQRTKEIGIRIALGARGADVTALFVKRGLRLTLIGVAIGLGLSAAVSKLMQGMLFGLTPTDGATFIGVAGLLTLVALLASWFPARRAASVDPLNALRSE